MQSNQIYNIMKIYLKKERPHQVFVVLSLVSVLLTSFFGVGWGILYVLMVNCLLSIKISLN